MTAGTGVTTVPFGVTSRRGSDELRTYVTDAEPVLAYLSPISAWNWLLPLASVTVPVDVACATHPVFALETKSKLPVTAVH